MTQEALRMAHKALIGLSIKHGEMTDEGMDAITAIEKALAQEKALQALHSENERPGLYKDAYAEQEPVAWAVYCDGFIALPAFDTEQDALKEMQRRNKKWPHNKREVKALYDAPPQPKQEPSGHFLDFAYSDSIAYVHVYDQFRKGQQFYKAPPQRTWVGIPEQDLKQGDESFFVAWREGARWAEAKLKERNT